MLSILKKDSIIIDKKAYKIAKKDGGCFNCMFKTSGDICNSICSEFNCRESLINECGDGKLSWIEDDSVNVLQELIMIKHLSGLDKYKEKLISEIEDAFIEAASLGSDKFIYESDFIHRGSGKMDCFMEVLDSFRGKGYDYKMQINHAPIDSSTKDYVASYYVLFCVYKME